MEASGDKAMEGGGGAAAAVSAGTAFSFVTPDISAGVEHDANRKLTTKVAGRRMGFLGGFGTGSL